MKSPDKIQKEVTQRRVVTKEALEEAELSAESRKFNKMIVDNQANFMSVFKSMELASKFGPTVMSSIGETVVDGGGLAGNLYFFRKGDRSIHTSLGLGRTGIKLITAGTIIGINLYQLFTNPEESTAGAWSMVGIGLALFNSGIDLLSKQLYNYSTSFDEQEIQAYREDYQYGLTKSL